MVRGGLFLALALNALNPPKFSKYAIGSLAQLEKYNIG
jgi:hypothetical protein